MTSTDFIVAFLIGIPIVLVIILYIWNIDNNDMNGNIKE